jgi:hypothetical protein
MNHDSKNDQDILCHDNHHDHDWKFKNEQLAKKIDWWVCWGFLVTKLIEAIRKKRLIILSYSWFTNEKQGIQLFQCDEIRTGNNGGG